MRHAEGGHCGAELCDLEGICARVKAGVLSTAVKQLADLCSKDENDKRSNHYLRWLRRSASLSKDPSFQIVRTIYEQPKESIVRDELDKLLNGSYPSSGLIMLAANRGLGLGLARGSAEYTTSIVT